MKVFPRIFGLAIILTAATLVGIGCSSDDNPTDSGGDGDNNGGGSDVIPSEWVGRWAGQLESQPCGIPGFRGGEPDTFSICEGQTVVGDTPGFEWNCDVDFSETQGTWDCTGTGSFQGCTLTIEFTGSATRNGNTLTISERIDESYAGENCFGQEDQCTEESATYTRISSIPDPEECGGGPGDGDGDGNGDGSGGELSADISGGGVNLTFQAEASAVLVGGSFYSVSATMLDGDDIYNIVFTTPEITKVPVEICIGDVTDDCVGFVYSEQVGTQQGVLAKPTGSMTVTRADADQFTATFSLGGELVGTRTGSRTISNGTVDAEVTTGGLRHSHMPGFGWR